MNKIGILFTLLAVVYANPQHQSYYSSPQYGPTVEYMSAPIDQPYVEERPPRVYFTPDDKSGPPSEYSRCTEDRERMTYKHAGEPDRFMNKEPISYQPPQWMPSSYSPNPRYDEPAPGQYYGDMPPRYSGHQNSWGMNSLPKYAAELANAESNYPQPMYMNHPGRHPSHSDPMYFRDMPY